MKILLIIVCIAAWVPAIITSLNASRENRIITEQRLDESSDSWYIAIVLGWFALAINIALILGGYNANIL